jgi:hypothetical protein|tara:strand:- start:317 stop:1516 length:1200 start_codon:yes stop_codon:yes gene_type:complete
MARLILTKHGLRGYRFKFRTFTASILGALLIQSMASAAKPTTSAYEGELISGLRQLILGQHVAAQQHLSALTQRYPQSRLGHLVHADVLAAQAGLSNQIDDYATAKDLVIIARLREQLKNRWDYVHNQGPNRQGQVPTRLLYAGRPGHQLIYVDVPASRLYLFEYLIDRPVAVQNYYVSIGRQGAGKEQEGDRRTPIGIYHTTGYIPGQSLHERYGYGALPINYPNSLDKSRARSGHGIWLHGTEPSWVNRSPLATDGCVSLSNLDFETLYMQLEKHTQTRVIIDDKPAWLPFEELVSLRERPLGILLEWTAAWKRGDKNALLEFYASSASPSISEKLIDRFSVINSQPEFYSYPGETDHLLAVFRIQATTGPVKILEQHWKRQSSNWKIVLETQVDLL